MYVFLDTDFAEGQFVFGLDYKNFTNPQKRL